jgi:hypothetical protein
MREILTYHQSNFCHYLNDAKNLHMINSLGGFFKGL